MAIKIGKAQPVCMRTSKKPSTLNAVHSTYQVAGIPVRVWSMYEPGQDHRELSENVLHGIGEMFPHVQAAPQADYVLVSRKVKEHCATVDVGAHRQVRVRVGERQGVVKITGNEPSPERKARQEKNRLSEPVVFNRLTLDSVKDKRGSATRRLQPDYYTIHRTLLQMAAVRGRTLVHGTAVAVDTPAGPRGVLFVGGQGVGKTETAMHAINVGCRHMEDDVVRLALRNGVPYIGGSGYQALLRFKNDITPRMRAHPEKFFLEYERHGDPTKWNHLPIRMLKAAGAIDRPFKNVSEIYQPDPVPLNTIVFLVPSVTDSRQEELHNMQLKGNVDLDNLVRRLGTEQWNTKKPQARKREMEKYFESAGTLQLGQTGGLVNFAENENTKALVTRWLQDSAENDYRANPKEVERIVSSAPNILVIGKWVPPEKDQAFAYMIKQFVEKNAASKK